MNVRVVNSAQLQQVELAFEPYLFFRPQLLFSQSSDAQAIALASESQVLGLLPFFHDDQVLKCPLRAPFGGIAAGVFLSESQLGQIIQGIVLYAKEKQMREIRLTQYPQCYNLTLSEKIDRALQQAGFEIQIEELNQHLPVSSSDFEEKLHVSEKRRLAKCKAAGFRVEVGVIDEVHQYFSLVKENRAFKGHPLTITEEGLKSVFMSSPEDYTFFSVYDQDKLIAAATGVRISAEILYYYLPGSDPAYAAYSPMVMLLEAMYAHCCAQAVTLFDLGISTSGGVLNEGLFRFKQHLGAEVSVKRSYKFIL